MHPAPDTTASAAHLVTGMLGNPAAAAPAACITSAAAITVRDNLAVALHRCLRSIAARISG